MVGSMFVFTLRCESIFIQTLSYVLFYTYVCVSLSVFFSFFCLYLPSSLVCMCVDVCAQILTDHCIRHSRMQVLDNYDVTVMIRGEPYTLEIFNTSGIIV